MLRSQRILLPLIALAVLLVILALTSTVKPAYADSPPDEWIWPGEGGGGGGGYPAYDIQGQVFNLRTGYYAAGVTVCVYNPWRELLGSTTTNVIGAFRIVSSGIYPFSRYQITVNGNLSELGTSAIDPHWCQWSGYVITDANAHGYLPNINLDTSTQVIVPYATLYSNTPYVDHMTYSVSSSHDETFDINVGVLGYSTANTWSVGISWSIHHQQTRVWGDQYYALAWYGLDQWGVPCPIKAGVDKLVNPNSGGQSLNAMEYLPTPDVHLTNCGLPGEYVAKAYKLDPDQDISFSYAEAGTVQWKYGFSGSVGISYQGFGIDIDIGCYATSTSGHESSVDLKIYVPPGDTAHWFVLYTKGFSFLLPSGPKNDPNNKAGLELHVWDAGAG